MLVGLALASVLGPPSPSMFSRRRIDGRVPVIDKVPDMVHLYLSLLDHASYTCNANVIDREILSRCTATLAGVGCRS